MKSRECFDEYRAMNQKTGEPVMMIKIKEILNAERIEANFESLKECDSKYLLKYLDLVKKDDELWVVIPSMIN